MSQHAQTWPAGVTGRGNSSLTRRRPSAGERAVQSQRSLHRRRSSSSAASDSPRLISVSYSWRSDRRSPDATERLQDPNNTWIWIRAQVTSFSRDRNVRRRRRVTGIMEELQQNEIKVKTLYFKTFRIKPEPKPSKLLFPLFFLFLKPPRRPLSSQTLMNHKNARFLSICLQRTIHLKNISPKLKAFHQPADLVSS